MSMNEISMQALVPALADLTNKVTQLTSTVDMIKAAHNNLANKAVADLNQMAATIQKLAGIVQQQQQMIVQLQAGRPAMQMPAQPQQRPQQQTRPAQPQSGPPPVAETAMPHVKMASPGTLPDPMSSGWAEDEEDAQIE